METKTKATTKNLLILSGIAVIIAGICITLAFVLAIAKNQTLVLVFSSLAIPFLVFAYMKIFEMFQKDM